MKKPLILLLLAMLAVMGASHTAKAQLINVTYVGKESGYVTGKELAADSMIKVVQPDVMVISFQMNHFQPGWSAIEMKSESNRITPQMRKEFKRVHRDDLLFFTNIKAVNVNGDTLFAHPINFRIK